VETVTLQTVGFKIKFAATFFSGKGEGVEREIYIDNENNIDRRHWNMLQERGMD
jgi:hypothetical protein